MSFKFLPVLGVLLLAVPLSSCGKKSQQDQIADAQTCLNNATPSTASQCQSMVSGINTAQAFMIQCASLYVQQGFADPTRLSNAFSQLTSSSGSASGTASASVTALGILAFNSSSFSDTENSSFAQDAQTYCQASGSPGLALLASMSFIATNIIQTYNNLVNSNPAIGNLISSGTVPSQADITAAQSSPQLQAAVGAAASDVISSNCADSSSANAQVCSQFSAAQTTCASSSSSTDTCLGQQLLNLYATSGSN